MSEINQITVGSTTYDIQSSGILYGEVDSTSTSTAFTATINGLNAYYDGVCILLKNGVVTSASGFTIDINNLGAKPVYSSMATGNDITPTAPSRETTLFNINYSLLLIYSSTLVDGGAWINYRGYNSNDNSIGYQLRTSSTVMKTSDQSRYYRLFFTSADGTHMVPANTAKDNSATSVKTVNQRPINPFGRIIYYGANSNLSAESSLSAAYLWDQYAFTLGYSFNTTGSALTLTTSTPVYIKCALQNDGSAIIDSTTPYVQALPTTADGKIYIFLGIASSETQVELYPIHPVYYYSNGAIRLWTNNSSAVTSVNGQTGDVSIAVPSTAADVGAVPTTRKVNNKVLSADITLAAGDVGAVPTGRTVNGIALSSNITLNGNNIYSTIDFNPPISSSTYPTLDEVSTNIYQYIGALTSSLAACAPASRTINGYALSSNITLSAADVGAASTGDVTAITELKFSSGFSVTWTASSPHSSDTDSVYSNRGAIPLTGVTAAMYPQVTFGAADAISGNYSPICDCYAGGVYIWSKNTTTPTILSIIVHK